MSLNALGFFSSKDRALTRSVVARSSPPISRSVSRKGRFVYPAKGDRNKFDFNKSGPKRIGHTIAEKRLWRQQAKIVEDPKMSRVERLRLHSPRERGTGRLPEAD